MSDITPSVITNFTSLFLPATASSSSFVRAFFFAVKSISCCLVFAFSSLPSSAAMYIFTISFILLTVSPNSFEILLIDLASDILDSSMYSPNSGSSHPLGSANIDCKSSLEPVISTSGHPPPGPFIVKIFILTLYFFKSFLSVFDLGSIASITTVASFKFSSNLSKNPPCSSCKSSPYISSHSLANSSLVILPLYFPMISS